VHVVHVQAAYGGDEFLQGRGRQRAGLGEDQDPVAELHQGGDGGDPGGCGQVLFGLGVDLGEDTPTSRHEAPPGQVLASSDLAETSSPPCRP
jgi:hypothetical protein